ncbi:MAG: DinB family protein [Synergistaceae bacterium]|nr:DinB family protein [Synergistaceae bacterium]
MRAVTDALKGSFDGNWGFLLKEIDLCPDSVWGKKAGGFVFWQQLYHCFATIDFFISPKDAAPAPGPWGADVAGFKAAPNKTATKDELRAYAAKQKAAADAWFATVDDASLLKEHEGLSFRWKQPMTNATVIALMTGHSMYHVGSCDAILRDNGVSGVL